MIHRRMWKSQHEQERTYNLVIRGIIKEVQIKFIPPGQLHNYFTIERKRGYGLRRNPLVFLVAHEGFEPSTS